jgi:hypothetical protein
LALDASPIATRLRDVVDKTGEWTGTMTALLRALNKDQRYAKQQGWPKSARALSAQVRRIVPNVAAVDITVTFERASTTKRDRIVTIACSKEQGQ